MFSCTTRPNGAQAPFLLWAPQACVLSIDSAESWKPALENFVLLASTQMDTELQVMPIITAAGMKGPWRCQSKRIL